MGFLHFSVVHKDGFRCIFTDGTTDKSVHTNTIEGGWHIANGRLQDLDLGVNNNPELRTLEADSYGD